jgi:hypothetical protein
LCLPSWFRSTSYTNPIGENTNGKEVLMVFDKLVIAVSRGESLLEEFFNITD